MDCCVWVFYVESVRKEDGMFEDMEEELEWFDEPPSFNDLCVRLNAKFGVDFTLNGRFECLIVGRLGHTMSWCPCATVLTGPATIGWSKVPMCPWLRWWWWRMGTGCRVSRRGRPLTVLEAMNKNRGSKGKQPWVTWIWTVSWRRSSFIQLQWQSMIWSGQ
jgi:hypothetical protein